ncbi:MAG: NAD-dependent epimerase/dehydratase family protein [Bacteroidales bacterium]|nr:NAD-dependent epimerase/dehydratase family protein [Bacteroidales bacterium]
MLLITGFVGSDKNFVFICSMILVTGGTGFIGAHLLYHLVVSGKKVRALKRASSKLGLLTKIFARYSTKPDELIRNIQWVEGDVLDIYSLLDAFEDIEQLYHTAAVVSFHPRDKIKLIRTNAEGTKNVVNAALDRKVGKLCHVSSIGALGRADGSGIVDETRHWSSKKSSVYSTSKHEAEREVWRGIAEGLNAVIVNPSIVLGPGNWGSGSPQVFQTMWNGLKFYTGGTNGFVDVNDVAKAMILLMESPINGERFILNSENIAYKQFFGWMAAAMNLPAPKYKAGPLLSGIGWRALKILSLFTGKPSSITKETAETANQHYRYSSQKIVEATGMNFIPVRESVEKTSAYFLHDLIDPTS